MAVQVLVRRGGPALVLADVAAEENARLIVVGAGEHSKPPAGFWEASPTWSPSARARPATC